MAFRINYFYEQGDKVFVSLARNGKTYDRECRLMGDKPIFKFLGRTWYLDTPLRRIY